MKKLHFTNMANHTKYLFTLFLIFICASNNHAQTSAGITGGGIFSTIRYSDRANRELIKPYKKIKSGLSGGIFVRHSLNQSLMISSDLNYARKGLKYKQEAIREGKTKLNYLIWSASGNIDLMPKDRINLHAGIGIYTAYLLHGNFTYTSLQTGETFSEPIEFNNPDYEYSRWDAGIKLNFILGKRKSPWAFMISYEHGMTESSKLNADSFKNRALVLCLQYSIKK